jgi:hypothetical protein
LLDHAGRFKAADLLAVKDRAVVGVYGMGFCLRLRLTNEVRSHGALSMRPLAKLLAMVVPTLVAGVPNRAGAADEPAKPVRMVLVELYTSQGCDMCPTAEKMLGALAERDPRIVPIAFHVDYFNEPWKDVFSDPLYSQRQMTYNQLYTKPKNPEYGIYFTPMLMIDGEQSVNGRDPTSAQAAIRRAMAREPAVALEVALDLKRDGISGTATFKVTSRSARAERSPLLVCAVLREDGLTTDVQSGENAGKSLVARFPARQTKYEFIELDGESPATQRFAFVTEPAWNHRKLRLAAFVQDKRTGVVHQAADLPWQSTPTARRRRVRRPAHCTMGAEARRLLAHREIMINASRPVPRSLVRIRLTRVIASAHRSPESSRDRSRTGSACDPRARRP